MDKMRNIINKWYVKYVALPALAFSTINASESALEKIMNKQTTQQTTIEDSVDSNSQVISQNKYSFGTAWAGGEPLSALEQTKLYENLLSPKALELKNLAFTAGEEKRYKDAINLYKKALNENPNNPNLFIQLGVAYHQNGDIQNCIKSYNDALRIDENYQMAFYSLAMIYYQQNDFKKSKNYVKKADLSLFKKRYKKRMQVILDQN
jgi:tetratricopeptide (TPR) repeat protein